jgi:hypothetical protein
MRFTGHAARDIEQAGEWVVSQVSSTEGAEVPVVVAHEPVVAERVGGENCHDRTRTVGSVHKERVAVRAPANLDAPAAADEVVIRGIEWEQHAHPAIRVGVQHDEVAVLSRLDVNAGAVAAGELLVIEIDANWGVIGL